MSQKKAPEVNSILSRMRSVLERLQASSRRSYREFGFEPAVAMWYGPLRVVAQQEGLGVKDIAKALKIAVSTTSQALKSMEQAGIIEFQADTEDRRRRVVVLTDKGKLLVERLQPLWSAFAKVSAELDQEAGGILKALDTLEAAVVEKSPHERVLEKLNQD